MKTRCEWCGRNPLYVAYTQSDIEQLLGNPGIIRNRLKIEAAIKNAQGTVAIQDKFGSLDAFLWRFVNGVPIQNN